MKLTTDTYQNHLDNEYRQRTEAFARQQRLAQSVQKTGITSFIQRHRMLLGVLLFTIIVLITMRTTLAQENALTDAEVHEVVIEVAVAPAFAGIILADAAFQPETARNAWTHLKQRSEWEKGRKRTLISYE